MFKTDNSLHVFVGRNNAGAYVVANDATAAAAGDIIIVDENGDDFAGAISGDFKVGQKDAGGSWRFTPLLNFADATVKGAIKATRYPQITTLDLCDDTPNTRYIVRINFTNNVELFSEQSDQYFFEYTTGDTVTAGEVMQKFVAKINAEEGCKDKVVAAYVATDGMTLTGLAQTWSLGLHKDTVVSFDRTIDGFVSTATNVLTQAPDPGNGQGRAVAELEWFGVGASGAPYRHGSVPSNQDLVTLYADSSAQYGVVSLDCKIAAPNHAVAGSGQGRCQVVIALVTGSTAAAGANTALGVTWAD